MGEYYGVVRSSEYLTHYGIKGMKWGIHKAKERRNDLALYKHYQKAQRKLARLKKQASNGSKYTKRAIGLGAGAALAGSVAGFGPGAVTKYGALGAGYSAVGVGKALQGIGELTKKYGKGKLRNAGYAIKSAGHRTELAGRKVNTAGIKAGQAVNEWGRGYSLRNEASYNLVKKGMKVGGDRGTRLNTYGINVGNSKALTNDRIVRGIAALGAAGLAGAAGYNAYRARHTKNAAIKAEQFQREMNKAFAGTRYATESNRRRKRR